MDGVGSTVGIVGRHRQRYCTLSVQRSSSSSWTLSQPPQRLYAPIKHVRGPPVSTSALQPTPALAASSSSLLFFNFSMMFTKFASVASVMLGMSSMFMGAAALPTNVTEIAARSIDPSGTHTGQLTYFEIGLGACGWTNSDTEWVAAISHELYDNWPGYAGGNPNNNPVCTTPHTADITYNGKTIRVGIVDRCEGCALWDLDLSPSAFQQFAPLASGRLYGATWHFN